MKAIVILHCGLPINSVAHKKLAEVIAEGCEVPGGSEMKILELGDQDIVNALVATSIAKDGITIEKTTKDSGPDRIITSANYLIDSFEDTKDVEDFWLQVCRVYWGGFLMRGNHSSILIKQAVEELATYAKGPLNRKVAAHLRKCGMDWLPMRCLVLVNSKA